MMAVIEGVLLFAQESRFQLLDRDGVGHHFVLSHSAAADPEQLAALRHVRVRVNYRRAEGVLAHAAFSISALEG